MDQTFTYILLKGLEFPEPMGKYSSGCYNKEQISDFGYNTSVFSKFPIGLIIGNPCAIVN